ncbi:YesL family protein [Salibacterium aidingense]|uniref:YesL family protein n=1 Tax=Salibacterium aidingense TaxID=384933 RepID=UPI001B7FA5D7|nr:YesL family protein [Salibacterium aidingense]
MNRGGIMGGLNTLMEWITRLAYVNLLWVLLTIAGLVVFGLFPATAAMFAVVRKWTMKELDIPVFQTFWREFRAEFLKSNGMGLILAAMAYVFYVDFQFFSSLDGVVSMLLLSASGSLFLVYLITSLFVFPVLAHYKLRLLQYFKQAFLIGISSPVGVISIIAAAVIIYFLTIQFPALLLFFSGSSLAYITMGFAMRTIRMMEEKKNLNMDRVEE